MNFQKHYDVDPSLSLILIAVLHTYCLIRVQNRSRFSRLHAVFAQRVHITIIIIMLSLYHWVWSQQAALVNTVGLVLCMRYLG